LNRFVEMGEYLLVEVVKYKNESLVGGKTPEHRSGLRESESESELEGGEWHGRSGNDGAVGDGRAGGQGGGGELEGDDGARRNRDSCDGARQLGGGERRQLDVGDGLQGAVVARSDGSGGGCHSSGLSK
jgi:hypothetical protein